MINNNNQTVLAIIKDEDAKRVIAALEIDDKYLDAYRNIRLNKSLLIFLISLCF